MKFQAYLFLVLLGNWFIYAEPEFEYPGNGFKFKSYPEYLQNSKPMCGLNAIASILDYLGYNTYGDKDNFRNAIAQHSFGKDYAEITDEVYKYFQNSCAEEEYGSCAVSVR